YFLHVWWARRPLTPSRAAIAASLLPEDTDAEAFVRMLGIEQKCALIDGEPWILTGDLLDLLETNELHEYITVTSKVINRFEKEIKRRLSDLEAIQELKEKLADDAKDVPAITHWEMLCNPFPRDTLVVGEQLSIIRRMGNPAWFNELMQISKSVAVRVPNLYGYERAYQNDYIPKPSQLTVLDPTAGGGSIPFEALRLGHNVIANELNPVATVILYATVDYPVRYGSALTEDIRNWGEKM
ncbi:DUF1156 domain-containing protein, partial [Thiolapillus sp.]|uniref:DUF1156 domain-containing protein n=1 Tax=Thiolapillus sp. TaxID=2017437 RepID=UPI003AF56C0F